MSRRLMLRKASGGGGILPPEYQQVKWISPTTNGNAQYINLGYALGGRDEIRAVFMANQGDLNNNALFGNQTANKCWLNVFTQYARLDLSFRYNTTSNYYTVGQYGEWLTFEFVNGEASIDGVVFDRKTVTDFTDSTFCGIFKASNYYSGIGIKLKEFEIIGKAHLYPCYRKSDGEIGMYDTVSGTFYTNAGTGTFTKGADVN